MGFLRRAGSPKGTETPSSFSPNFHFLWLFFLFWFIFFLFFGLIYFFFFYFLSKVAALATDILTSYAVLLYDLVLLDHIAKIAPLIIIIVHTHRFSPPGIKAFTWA